MSLGGPASCGTGRRKSRWEEEGWQRRENGASGRETNDYSIMILTHPSARRTAENWANVTIPRCPEFWGNTEKMACLILAADAFVHHLRV